MLKLILSGSTIAHVLVMFLPPDFRLEYRTELITIGIPCIEFIFSLIYFKSVFQALRLIVLVMFWAVDQPLAAFMLVHVLET